MPVLFAYTAVIIVWSTTPLTIKWSGDGLSPLYGAAGRIAVATVGALLLAYMMKIPIRTDRKAMLSYAMANAGWTMGMICVYVAAVSLPSGVISVLYGLSPLLTALLARYVLPDERLNRLELGAIILGLVGMLVVFHNEVALSNRDMVPLLLVLLSVVGFCVSNLGVKRINAELHPLGQAAGSLLMALPIYAMVAFIGGNGELTPSPKAIGSIVYLGIVGSLVGLISYFYVLERLEATKVAMIPMITPVFALLLGAWLNQETITLPLVVGGAIILVALLGFQWANKNKERRPE